MSAQHPTGLRPTDQDIPVIPRASGEPCDTRGLGRGKVPYGNCWAAGSITESTRRSRKEIPRTWQSPVTDHHHYSTTTTTIVAIVVVVVVVVVVVAVVVVVVVVVRVVNAESKLFTGNLTQITLGDQTFFYNQHRIKCV